MEHTSYWKWGRTKLIHDVPTTPPLFNRSSYNEYSWEEQAFAEDSNGLLGGCAWPPRSYTCSFCKRVFRSAQALGGHMNVHRRDRARLKQSSNPVDEDFTPNPNPGALELKLELGNCKKRNWEDDDDEEEEVVCSNNKRRRISEVIKVSTRLVEEPDLELDLELRLGEPPKVLM